MSMFLLNVHDNTSKMSDLNVTAAHSLGFSDASRAAGLRFRPFLFPEDWDAFERRAAEADQLNRRIYYLQNTVYENTRREDDQLWLNIAQEYGTERVFYGVGRSIRNDRYKASRTLLCLGMHYNLLWTYEQVAETVSKAMSHDNPKKGLISMLRNMGVVCFTDRSVPTSVIFRGDGILKSRDGRKIRAVILYNPHYPQLIQLKFLLHETAHLLLGHVETDDAASFRYGAVPSLSRELPEVEAEALSGMFLLPRPLLFQEICRQRLLPQSLISLIPGHEEMIDSHLKADLEKICELRLLTLRNSYDTVDFFVRHRLEHLLPVNSRRGYCHYKRLQDQGLVHRENHYQPTW